MAHVILNKSANDKIFMARSRPAHAIPEKFHSISRIFKWRWVRELMLLPHTISGKRNYNKTADYGVFKDSDCLLSHLEQSSYIVTDIAETRKWFETVGFTHSRTCDPEPHPNHEGHTVTCCYMDAKSHEECLLLIEHRDKEGNIVVPSITDVFHGAYELTGNTLPDTFQFTKEVKDKNIKPYYGPAKHNNSQPHGDGESGGNVAVYYYTPDYHHIEFFTELDTVDNYSGRYGTGVRSTSNDEYLESSKV